jgi:putative tryptophan/tyrosine transport system substrate-binding protein
MVNRRLALFVAVVLGVLCIPFAPAAQDAKPAKTARIGRLSPLSAEADMPGLEAFRKGLRDLGWVEGRDFAIEARFAEGKPERLPELAVQLVRNRVDVILAGSTPGALAAKKATSTIPIVMVTTGDPVEGGLVASLAQPGGNITGVTALGEVLSMKRLQLLKEAVPGVTRVAVLANPVSPYTRSFLRARDSAAQELRVRFQLVEAHDATKLERAFAAMVGERAGALMVLTDVMFISNRRRIVELAAKARLPAVYPEREFVGVGGLMFYGASLVDMYSRAAVYADRILKGGKPAELPVEQPTKLELTINLKTAKALGLTIPPSMLARADELIQ